MRHSSLYALLNDAWLITGVILVVTGFVYMKDSLKKAGLSRRPFRPDRNGLVSADEARRSVVFACVFFVVGTFCITTWSLLAGPASVLGFLLGA